MLPSGMLHHMALVRTYVSEEQITSIIRVTRNSKLGATLKVTINQSMHDIEHSPSSAAAAF
jgi:hypothetical protein